MPDSFRIARSLLDRIEDPSTGTVTLEACYVDIPEDRQQEAEATADVLAALPSGVRQALIPAAPPELRRRLVARCRNPGERTAVAAELRRRYPDMAVMTREEFAGLTQSYWLVKTNAETSSLQIPRPTIAGIDFRSDLHYYWLSLGVLIVLPWATL